MAATLRDNCDRQFLFFNFPHATVEQGGQTVTPTELYVLETIKFYARYKYGDPGTCYISLQETTDGLPNGNLLTDRASFTVTVDKVLKSITFSTQPVLQIGTKYAIVFEAPSGVASSKELYLYGETATGIYYAGGDRVWYNGSVWAAVTTQDLNFYCWGSAATPTKPTAPSPSHPGTNITLDESQLSWTAGADTTTFDIYFGESGSEVLVAEEQDVSDENWAITFGTLDYGTTYGWRVDATNVYGTTTGDTWTFTTITFNPPVPTGVGSASPNMMQTIKRLVAVARNKIFYENI